jgi:hypothetical protein
MTEILIPVSAGELFDKITILKIKLQKIQDQAKLRNVHSELLKLEKVVSDNGLSIPTELFDRLMGVNNRLWETEDLIREKESKGLYDDDFIRFALLDAQLNDLRFVVKREINNLFDSSVKEEKSYSEEVLNRKK